MRLGIDFGGTNIKFGLFSEEGSEIAFQEEKVSTFTEHGELLENILDYSVEFCMNQPIEKGGLAIKGLVDTEKGMLYSDIGIAEQLANVNLQKAFQEKLQIPFIIENDARAYMLGEWRFGAGRGTDVMACMTLGTGLGCAIIVNGQAYRGADQTGGLLGGHISINNEGPQCSCGQRGCLELYCSATAFNKHIKEIHPELIQFDEALPPFFAGIESGRTEFKPALEKFLDQLAAGVVNIIHAFNPEMVVLGGGVLESAHLILPGLRQRVNKMAWTQPRGRVKIEVAQLANRAAALGIAFHPQL